MRPGRTPYVRTPHEVAVTPRDPERRPVDIAHGEMVEKDLDRLIEKRAAVEDPEAKEALWFRSVERYNARRRDQNRWEWVRHFDRMAANHAAISEDYQRRAEALCVEDRGGE
jgi:hypothetical protein